MKAKKRTRMSAIAIMLALVFSFTLITPVAAATASESTVPGDSTVQTDLPPETIDEPDEPAEEPGNTPGDNDPAPPAAEPEDSTPQEPPVEPNGVLPETSGIALTASMVAEKQAMAEMGIAVAMATMESDQDYVNHEVLYMAASEEEAKQVAKAYNGIVTSFSHGVAVIKTVASTLEAVEKAEDLNSDFPAVYPNFMYYQDDIRYSEAETETPEPGDEASAGDGTEETPENNEDDEVEVILVDDETDIPPEAKTADEIETIFEQREVTAADIAALDTMQEAELITESDLASDDISANAISLDPFVEKQWHHDKINTATAWGADVKGNGVTVAVIDSGIDAAHPDLKKNIAGKFVTAGHAINGTADNSGHGTHVAGIIAAQANNNIGVAGVAPEAKIISIKALDYYWSGGYLRSVGSSADIARAVNMAVSKKVHVINMSLGGDYGTDPVDEVYRVAVENAVNKGIVVVVAAGNETSDLASSTINVYPAEFPNVITVSATTEAGPLAYYSNFGAGKITIAAPGGGATTSGGTGRGVASTYKAKSYAWMPGTSMATPVVSGVVALAISANPTFKSNRTLETVEEVTRLLKSTANTSSPYTSANSAQYGAGLVDAGAVATTLTGTTATTPELSQPNKAALKSTNTDGTVSVNITNYSPAYTYYYTVNGKAPTLTSTKTTGAIAIETSGKKSVTVKVVAANAGRKFGATATYTYAVSTGVASITTCTSSTNSNTVGLGKTLTYSPVFSPAKPTKKTVTWSSSDPAIATVSAKGVVKGVAAGTAVITATSVDNNAATYSITVTVAPATTKLTVTPAPITLATTPCTWNGTALSNQQTLTVTAEPAGALTGPVNYTYKTSNQKVATVSTSGVVTAVGKGTAKITATARDGSNKTATTQVTVVKPASIASITCKQGQPTGTTYTVAKGKSINLTAVLADKTATNTGVEWTTAETGKVKVSGGTITGLDVTTTPVTVTVKTKDGVEAAKTISINVKEATTGLTVTSSTGSNVLKIIGNTYGGAIMQVTQAPATAHNKFDFTSSNKKVATVNADTGLVQAVGKGSATITAKATDGSGKSKTFKVTVVKPVTAIYVSIPTTGVAVGKKVKFTATVYPTDASNKKVQWGITGDTSYFQIDQSGNLKATKKYYGSTSTFPNVKVYAQTKDTYSAATAPVYAGGGTGTAIYQYNDTPASLKFSYNSKLITSFTMPEGYYDIVDPIFYYYVGRSDYYKTINASSSNDRVAELYYDNTAREWRLVGYSPGKAVITIKTADGSNKSAKLKVTITAEGDSLLP